MMKIVPTVEKPVLLKLQMLGVELLNMVGGLMRLENMKSISYLKANAAEMLADIQGAGDPFVITQNGEAKAVLQSVRQFQKTQETMALLKILELGQKQVQSGNVVSATDSIGRLRKRNASSTD